MQFVTVECSCGRKAQIPAETFEYTPQEFKVDKLADKLPKLKCRDCRSKANFVFNERDQLLFDLSNLSLCSSCETPLSVARLNAVPGTSVCTLCAQGGADDARTPPPHPQPPSEFSKCPTCEEYGRNARTEMRQKRWSRKFGPVVKVDRLMKVTIQYEETKEPFSGVQGQGCA